MWPQKLSLRLSLSHCQSHLCTCSLSANLIPGMESWFTILLDSREGQGLEHQELPMMPGVSVRPVLYHAGKRNRKCRVSIPLRPKQEKTPNVKTDSSTPSKFFLHSFHLLLPFKLFSLITLNVSLPFLLVCIVFKQKLDVILFFNINLLILIGG